MRSPKQSDSPCGYCRDVYKKRVKKAVKAARKEERDRAARRIQALMPVTETRQGEWTGSVQ